jgi:hypothetical protein
VTVRQRDGRGKRKREKEAGREREKKEACRGKRNDGIFFLLIYEFAEELQCSTNLLSTVTTHHFADLVVEPNGESFWLFDSTN